MPVPKRKPSNMADLPKSEDSEPEGGDENMLTSIHGPIHSSAAHEGGDDESVLDRVQIQAFLDTLAEIALAIASRTESTNEDKKGLAA